jgi:hypothetical protein
MTESEAYSNLHHERYDTNRDGFAHAVAEVVSRGHVLSGKDLEEIATHYDFTRGNMNAVIWNYAVQSILTNSGVSLATDSYRQSKLYYDENASEIEPGMDRAKEVVDKRIMAANEKRRSTAQSMAAARASGTRIY